jgi:hypothetical protein
MGSEQVGVERAHDLYRSDRVRLVVSQRMEATNSEIHHILLLRRFRWEEDEVVA